jgi:hypothetical protein
MVQVLGTLPLLGKACSPTEPKSFPTRHYFILRTKTSFTHRGCPQSELGLALGIIQCLARVFGHRLSGLVLAGLIPSAGSLFPFLESSDDDDTHEELRAICVTALRNMVLIDCDALWRLLDLSAGGYRRARWAYLLQPKMRRANTRGSPDNYACKRANN